MQIIECVPNFSEGRDRAVLKALEEAVTSTDGVRLLRSEMDVDHHRSVLTFIGSPEAVCAAAFTTCERAASLIDLRNHMGVHPRIGATDVIPLIPVSGITMEECILLAEELGARIANQLHIPVYLYEAAARRPDRKNLAHIRAGGFNGLAATIASDPSRRPDFGLAEIHPTAGAVAVGVRKPLIAYNVILGTSEVAIARRIARTIRERDGGLKAVKALGLPLESRGLTQVSMNLTDYKETSLAVVYERVREEAEKHGVTVIESELVGLINLEAVIEAFAHFIQLKDMNRNRILDLFVDDLNNAQ